MCSSDLYNVPEGFVLLLVKALYGLKQAGRQWYKTLSETLRKYGLVQIANNPHTFIVHRMYKGKCCTLIAPVYVDDLLPLGEKCYIEEFQQYLLKSFEVSTMGDASFFLGIRIRHECGESPRLKLDQHAFVQTILKRFNVTAPKTPVRTPLSTTKDLVPNDEPIENVIPAVRQLYQSKIGSLMYLMLRTRPDLAYSIGKLASFSSNPSPHHIHTLDRVLLYLCESASLHLDWWPERQDLAPSGFTDADFAGDSSDQKSIRAYCFDIGGTVFLWSSKKESTVATSTMEAEYITLYMGPQQAAWIYQFHKQIGFPLDEPIEIFCDSQPALSVAKGEETH